MPQPASHDNGPPARRRLTAVPPELPATTPHPITPDDARRLLASLADRAAAAGDVRTAARRRKQLAKVEPGYEFEAFLTYRVT